MKDIFKRNTMKNFTCYDLNAKCVKIKPKNRRKLVAIAHRNARRKDKLKIKKINLDKIK